MTAAVWIASSGEGREPEGLRERLGALGVRVTGWSPGHAGPGIFAFAEPGERTLRRLQELARGGPGRVLALGVGLGVAELSRQAWRLLAAGAADVAAWAEAGVEERLAARLRRWVEVEEVLGSPLVTRNLVGRSGGWRAALGTLVEAARYSNAPVLIEGESGTGKERAAQLVHTLSPRPKKEELVVLDATTIVPELSGSELFGHERGAFTDAHRRREGAIALADGGTLFLDEVGELPLRLQAELLRVLQEGTYKPVGGNTWLKSRFRLVCATNRNLRDEVAAGRFRHDLYHRLSAIHCVLPPLRERGDDVELLVEHFLQAESGAGEAPRLDPIVRAWLREQPFPGNVRELHQLVKRMLVSYAGGGLLTIGDVPRGALCAATPPEPEPEDRLCGAVGDCLRRGLGLRDVGRLAEDLAVKLVVDEEGGNLQRAAMRLGVTDRALQLRRQRAVGAEAGEVETYNK